MSEKFESLELSALQDFSVAQGHMHSGIPPEYATAVNAPQAEQAYPKSVLEVKDLDAEAELRDKSAAFIGRALLSKDVAVEPLHDPESPSLYSLNEALPLAGKGDPVARKMIYTNVLTDQMERKYKSGAVVEVEIERGPEGHKQYGQSMQQVNENSLQSIDDPIMVNLSKIETHNRMRQEHYDREGLFSTRNMVTFSLASQKYKSYGELKQAGYFPETMSAAIQIVGEDQDGDLHLESAFVAGAEEGAVSPQGMDRDSIFDVDAIVELAKGFGVDYSGLDAEGILAQPLMIPKDQMPNGAIDLVRLYDDAVERVTGKPVFFGRPHEGGVKDYEGHLKLCEERETQAEEAANATVDQLISEADMLTTRKDATTRLHMLNDAQLKREVITNSDIDVNVLGYHVADEIRQARACYAVGDMESVRVLQDDISARGESSSCPLGKKIKNGESSVIGGADSQNTQDEGEVGGGSDKYGSKTFECPKGHKNERPHNKLISNCTTCDCDVSCGNSDAIDTRPVAGPRLEEIVVSKSMIENVIEDAENFLEAKDSEVHELEAVS